jgi:ribonuclease E
MLINAQTKEELRVAIVDGHTLEDFQVEVAERGSTRGNIYRGTIAKVEPSLNAAFIDYGADRHGFLPIQDVVEEAWYKKPKDKSKRPRIEEVLERGKPIVVQVVKEAEEQKGAALTTNLSLAGRYLVLTPFDDTRGISRKVEDEAVRKTLKEQIKKLEVPDGCGIILRTNASDQTKTSLSRDLASLLRLWKRVGTEARRGKGVTLIYSDQDLILQALRDYLDTSMQEILVDDDSAYARAEEYLKAYMPRGGDRLIRYTDREPLFSRYGLEPQIDRIYDRRVFLPSGGSIVIDRTEALTAVDVNSGRSTGAASQEQTAVDTNLEAAAEVARQLRLRDIGGLVVVDFIDMRANRNQRKVEKALKDAMKADKARFNVGRISSNGLLEINRQRIHQALSMRTHKTCPTCDGTGRVPGPEMVGLNLLRRIRARAATAPLAKVRIALNPDLAEAVQNQRRRDFAQLEEEYDLRIELVASHRLNLREQEVEWEKREDSGNGRPAMTPIVRPASVRVGETAEAAGDEEEDDAAAAAEAEAKPKRKRKRRRKRSGESTAAQGGGKETGGEEKDAAAGGRGKGGEDEPSDRGTAGGRGRRGGTKAASAKAAEAAGDDEGTGTPKDASRGRGRSRRRRGGRAGDEAGSGDRAEAPAAESGGETAAAGDAAAAADGRERTPARRRRRSRADGGETAAGTEAGSRAAADGGGTAASSAERFRERRRRRAESGGAGGEGGTLERLRSRRSREGGESAGGERPRRRGSRDRSGDGGGEAEGGGAGPAESGSAGGGETEGGGQPRRRRRRPRRSSGDES